MNNDQYIMYSYQIVQFDVLHLIYINKYINKKLNVIRKALSGK